MGFGIKRKAADDGTDSRVRRTLPHSLPYGFTFPQKRMPSVQSPGPDDDAEDNTLDLIEAAGPDRWVRDPRLLPYAKEGDSVLLNHVQWRKEEDGWEKVRGNSGRRAELSPEDLETQEFLENSDHVNIDGVDWLLGSTEEMSDFGWLTDADTTDFGAEDVGFPRITPSALLDLQDNWEVMINGVTYWYDYGSRTWTVKNREVSGVPVRDIPALMRGSPGARAAINGRDWVFQDGQWVEVISLLDREYQPPQPNADPDAETEEEPESEEELSESD